jgi:hypothetical protein
MEAKMYANQAEMSARIDANTKEIRKGRMQPKKGWTKK